MKLTSVKEGGNMQSIENKFVEISPKYIIQL